MQVARAAQCVLLPVRGERHFMDRRGLLSMMTAGAAAGLAGTRLAFAETPQYDAGSVPTRLSIFVPTTQGSGMGRMGTGLEEALRAEGLAREIALVYAPRDTTTAAQRLAELATGGDDLLVLVSAGLIGGAIMERFPLEQTLVAPIARLICEHLVLAVSDVSDISTLRDLVISLALEPAAIRFVGGPLGGTEHMLVAAIAAYAGVDPNRLNYSERSGGESAAAPVREGKATCAVGPLSGLQLDISLGHLRGLAISSPQRLPGVSIPTFEEMGVELRMDNWRGVFASPLADAAQRQRLAQMIARLVTTPSWKAKIFQYNWMGAYLPVPAFAEFLAQDIARTRRRLAELGLT